MAFSGGPFWHDSGKYDNYELVTPDLKVVAMP